MPQKSSENRTARANDGQKGFIALVSVLILGAVILVVGIGMSLRGAEMSLISIQRQESERAAALAELCAEQAMMRLKSFLHYAGNESIIVDGMVCDILPIGGSGNLNRTVQTRASVAGFTRKLKIVVARISPDMQISQWDEVADF